MYFLELQNICEMESLNILWSIVGFIVDAIWFGIPIILIILGMIDLGKAVIANKDDEIKKATKAFGKRFLAAVAVFAVVWIVTFVFDAVAGMGLQDGENATGWKQCWDKIRG